MHCSGHFLFIFSASRRLIDLSVNCVLTVFISLQAFHLYSSFLVKKKLHISFVSSCSSISGSIFTIAIEIIDKTSPIITEIYRTLMMNCPVGSGCTIHPLLLCKGVIHPRQECPEYDIWWWVSSNAGTLRNAEYPIVDIAYMPTLAQSGSTW